MPLINWVLKNRTVAWVMVVFLIAGGLVAYEELGRLEDPEFTIKDALVVTAYPGATSQEVEEEVTDVLETAIQQLSQLDEIKSISKYGLSTITVKIKDKFDKATLPQVWDELRRKVVDAQSQLPPGAGASVVYDDFGDVFGTLLAIHGEGFSYAELYDYADFLKRELLLIPDVARITIWGKQQEQITVEISQSRLAQLGISLGEVYRTLEHQNLVTPAGSVRVDDDYIRFEPSGGINSVEEIKNLLISGRSGNSFIYLHDFANISRDYVDPPSSHLRHNGSPALSIGISTAPGGNVVKLGKSIEKRLAELEPELPLGLNLDPIYFQAEGVAKSVNGFVVNLVMAIVIVIVVLMIFMGIRSGLLIGVTLLLTVCSTLILMNLFHIDLQRISLGALVIALGMLVDNAIVVTEGILIRMQRGIPGPKAAREVVSQSLWPLFGATVVAVLAFAAIGLSQDSTGEYTRSLFQVILISLGMSWLIGVTLTPLFCVIFLKPKINDSPVNDEATYQGAIFTAYRALLKAALHYRKITLGLVVVLLGAAIYAFTLLEDSFFPDSTNPEFMVHYWLPEGTDIRRTSDDLKEIEAFILKQPGVQSVSTFVGEGAPRFMLVYSPEKAYSSYGLLLITMDDYRKIDALSPIIRDYLTHNFVDSNPKIEKIKLGPGGGFDLEARFSGPNPVVLRQLAEQAMTIMHNDAVPIGIRNDWRERVQVVRPQFSEAQARRAGVTREDLSRALETNFSGTTVGLYREGDKLIPIVSRAPANERKDINSMNDIQIWSHSADTVVPIQQAVNGFPTVWENPLIMRRDKKRTITAQSDPSFGNASVVFERIQANIEAIPLPMGYSFAWGGEYENSKRAQTALKKNLPITILLMIFATVMLFNAIRQPLVIWLTVPLAIIGVSAGLLVAGLPFDFMALLGFLSLSGMLIKNSIVLLDEIDLYIKQGEAPYSAIINASVSRMRPVMMAALTTVLGMTPLLFDVFFVSMAVTIMAGLTFATILTLVVVPVFYALLFHVPYSAQAKTT